MRSILLPAECTDRVAIKIRVFTAGYLILVKNYSTELAIRVFFYETLKRFSCNVLERKSFLQR